MEGRGEGERKTKQRRKMDRNRRKEIACQYLVFTDLVSKPRLTLCISIH